MADNRSNLTPEKQLLKLIEESHSASLKGTVAKGGKMPSMSFGALQGRFGFFQQAAMNTWKGWSARVSGPIDIKKINGFLTFLAVVMGVFFVASFIVLALRFTSVPSFSFKSESGDKIMAGKYTSQLKALAFYKEKIAARDLFQLGPRKEAPGETAAPDKAAKEAETALSKYKLVGISWSDNPDAMVESSVDQKTYFLKRGQTLDGVKVEAIYKDKIVLSLNGQEAELR